ncbi:hypothetical protein ACJ73_08088 [Blastomyces percursus]|uniref:Uncharacterized protein n=1 Tax=Blastomyces percursus TaxID=1658174 RepID=A0A1J9QK71_9EURO|nr:hypothetical protein ACJ73_08088 [Blastomyces percursus]
MDTTAVQLDRTRARAVQDDHRDCRAPAITVKCTATTDVTSEDTSTSASASQASNKHKRNHEMTEEAAHPSKRTGRSGRNQQLSGSARIDSQTSKNVEDVKVIVTPNKAGHPSRRGAVPSPKTSALNPRHSSPIPNAPLRRSARIAQRVLRLNAAIGSSSEIAKPCPRTRKPGKAPTDPANTKT